MAYFANIPQSTDFLSVSQAQILENFTQVENQYSNDHFSLLGVTDAGKHQKVTLPILAADPAALPGTVTFYSKNDALAKPRLYSIDPDAVVAQLTGSFTSANPGHTTLLGGLKMNFGSFTGNGNTAVNVTFNSAYTVACYSAVISGETSVSTWIVEGSVSLTKIQIKGPTGKKGYYMAIGV